MGRIAVCDDAEDIRRLLKVILTQEGHSVTSVADGDALLELLVKEPPDLVVLDVMMPKKDGFMVLKEMKSKGVRDSTKVLLLTARTAESDWLRGYKLGADQYLTKPFDIQELTAAIETLLLSSKEQLKVRREEDLNKAQLLSRLESLFEA
jgi:DNA-binding response OmpR family regulator